MKDHSFFDEFFSTSTKESEVKCVDCGCLDSDVNRLSVLFSDENGDSTWICSACKFQRNQRNLDRAAHAQSRVAEEAMRDSYEEAVR